MRKIVSFIVFATVVVGVGFYSLALRAQQRAEQQVNSVFAALRDALGSGTIGKVEFDLRQRTFKVTGIELQTSGKSGAGINTSGATFKVRELIATGIDIPADWRLSADRIEALDVEISGSLDLQPAMNFVYKAPRIILTDYRGPIAPLRPVNTSSAFDVARLVLEHIVASAATSVSIPTLIATLSPATPGPQPLGPVTYTYTDFALHDIRNGRVADMSVERAQFTMTTPPEVFGKISGEVGKTTVADFDAGALLAVLDPAKNKDDRLLRLQGRSTAGPYTLRFDNGGSLQIAGIEVGSIGVRPSKLRFTELVELTEALAPRAGAPTVKPDPTEIANLLADMHEGISMDLFEIRGVTLNVPQTPPFKLGAFRIKGLDHGKLAELAIEGAEGQTPQQQPFKLGRFALKGIDLANMVRATAQFATGPETPEKFAALAALLEGAEIKDLIAPYKNTRSNVRIDTFAVSWGQFVGPIPTAAHVTARISGPLDIGDPDVVKLLAGAGITSATVNLDLGAAWTEATKVFALAPASLELSNLFSLAARVSLGNVPREMFSLNPTQATLAAAQVEAGLIELVLRDAGALDLAIAQIAKQQGQPVPAARMALIESLNQAAVPLIAANPDLRPVVTAIARFIEAPRSALTLRVIPKGHVPLQSIIESAAGDPAAVLSQFRIEVMTGP
jgi:hypothetical protein